MDKEVLKHAIHVAQVMIEWYEIEKRGYSQKEALKVLIDLAEQVLAR